MNTRPLQLPEVITLFVMICIVLLSAFDAAFEGMGQLHTGESVQIGRMLLADKWLTWLL